ncbi:MAG: twin-arginine translocase subunit TatC [Bacteroidales bacterium]|nr:twin-arginine translocase subunit TatC [Bacteroidales bacterium]
MTFWEHLDELRSRLWRMVVAALASAVVCFCFKEPLFAVVLAPKGADIHLVNIEIAQQFLTHMRVSLWAGIIIVSPYLLYQLFAFVAPGLYDLERRLTLRAVGAAYLLFLAGLLLNYFVIFPFSVHFLATYQVSPDVANHISLSSYISLFTLLSLLLGVLFEIPVVCWLLARFGVLHAAAMRRYRRHALVAILIVAAVITPTGDPVTLSLVAVPIYLLYEVSILTVKKTEQ